MILLPPKTRIETAAITTPAGTEQEAGEKENG